HTRRRPSTTQPIHISLSSRERRNGPAVTRLPNDQRHTTSRASFSRRLSVPVVSAARTRSGAPAARGNTTGAATTPPESLQVGSRSDGTGSQKLLSLSVQR